MRTPSAQHHYSRCVHAGRYVTAQLRQQGYVSLTEDTQVATTQVKEAGRKMEDSLEPIEEAMARRDSAESALAESAQEFRLKLSARSLKATSEPPYTHIFPKGIRYYTSVPLDQVTPRYGELLARTAAALPEDDVLRQTVTEAVTAGLERFSSAVDEIAAARTVASIARTQCNEIRRKWNDQMFRVYGALVAELGSRGADRFFPRPQRRAGTRGVEDAVDVADDSSAAGVSEDTSTPIDL